ncbi:hypothetical protein [Serratia sp. Se-RSBMAAmG]|uniref:hypothetical protein n=1 Tax=Serratia sp. Se-RSBMAAmG TaxID=3043305 RepID=UPI0024AF3266|nr:hypothetical protein [Serratia sp. Se-RSBMAAmG]MDI6976107.1 hypothetical protein [Serratia sp. Se-RSBMAAmG]
MNQDFIVMAKESLELLPGRKNSYFKSSFHEFAFYLHINNPIFDKNLGICRVHMIDKEKALELCDFYRGLFQTIKPIEQYHNLDYIKIAQDIDLLYNRLTSGLL